MIFALRAAPYVVLAICAFAANAAQTAPYSALIGLVLGLITALVTMICARFEVELRRR